MPHRPGLTLVSTVVLALGLAACGSGGSGIASTPPPTPAPSPAPSPTPSPTPTPAPTPAGSLVPPVQTPPPNLLAAPPIAVPFMGREVPSFNGPTVADTKFGLMTTAVGAEFQGDAATTGQGATLTFDIGYMDNLDDHRLFFTVNNRDVGISDAPVGSSLLPDGRRISVFLGPDANLDYTRFGSWDVYQTDGTSPNNITRFLSAGAWLGGYITPSGSIPLSGSASYTGGVRGHFGDEGAGASGSVLNTGYLFGGTVQLTADFAARTIEGAMTGLNVVDEFGFNASVNDIGFAASLDRSQNLFTGTTRATSQPDSMFALRGSATGALAGRFFGPAADEVGAVWTLSDGTRHLIGSFGAGRK